MVTMLVLFVLVLLAGFASQGGRASVTYQPTPLKGDGQGCPSDENMAQAIENFHSLIEERVETESTPETRLLTELNTAVETLSQEVAELSINSLTANETLTELNQEVAELSTATTLTEVLQVINEPGLTRVLPAESCSEIFDSKPDLPSGNYWITSSNETAVQLYCNNIMARRCCGETIGGWTRVAYLNMTDPNQQCPVLWREISTSGVRSCTRTNNAGTSCYSAFYHPNTGGNSYSRVCGRVLGYQYCTTDGFRPGDHSIETVYVDGVSITHGSPRQHVWSFVAGVLCPCPHPGAPSFVGNDYFCDRGTDVDTRPCGVIQNDLLIDHPLWDGGGCSPTGACCEINDPPWFCTTLPQPTTDDIEVRICADQHLGDEEVTVGQIEIFVN